MQMGYKLKEKSKPLMPTAGINGSAMLRMGILVAWRNIYIMTDVVSYSITMRGYQCG